MLVRDCSYVRQRSGEMADQKWHLQCIIRFERVHRFSVEAAMRHMPLLQCIGLLHTYCTLIREDPTRQPFLVIYYASLSRQSTLVTETNHVPRDMINADRKGRYHTRRSGDGSASGAATHTASGARLVVGRGQIDGC